MVPLASIADRLTRGTTIMFPRIDADRCRREAAYLSVDNRASALGKSVNPRVPLHVPPHDPLAPDRAEVRVGHLDEPVELGFLVLATAGQAAQHLLEHD